MSMLPKIDEHGFHAGFLSEEALQWGLCSDDPPVIFAELPATPLATMEKFRWENGAWVARVDHRGHAWFDPEDPDRVHRPTSWDDAPPAGFELWVPGQNRNPTAAAAIRKARERKLAALAAARQAQETSGVEHDGQTWACDPAHLQGLALAAQDMANPGGPPSLTWETKDGQLVVLTMVDVRTLIRAIRTHMDTKRERFYTVKAQVQAATTVEEIEGIEF